jgi:hypothetical protein
VSHPAPEPTHLPAPVPLSPVDFKPTTPEPWPRDPTLVDAIEDTAAALYPDSSRSPRGSDGRYSRPLDFILGRWRRFRERFEGKPILPMWAYEWAMYKLLEAGLITATRETIFHRGEPMDIGVVIHSTARLWELRRGGRLVAALDVSPSVELPTDTSPSVVIVCGHRLAMPSKAAAKAIHKLLRVFPEGLTLGTGRDDLTHDERATLADLRRDNVIWAAAIAFPGKKGGTGGYRVRPSREAELELRGESGS